MPPTLRSPYSAEPRTLVGVAVSAAVDEVRAVSMAVERSGLESRLRVVGRARSEVPRDATTLYDRLARGRGHPAEIAALSSSLAEVATAVVREVSDASPPLAVGTVDPGLWLDDAERAAGRISLSDPARLAEATGFSIVDDFAARELAQGGSGNSIDAIPLWLLLHSAKNARVAVDLRSRLRLIYLPASSDGSGAERMQAHEMESAEQPIAELVARRIREWVPKAPPLREVVFLGGDECGRSAEEIAAAIPELQSVSLDEIGTDPSWLDAAVAAAHALLHIDQVPTGGSPPMGASAPRLLGRLTPGSPQHWRRLLRHMAESQPERMSLRAAM